VIILFRGGMVGDLVGLMLDKTLGISTDYSDIVQDVHSFTAGYVLDPYRTKLKKYWKYDDNYKNIYINNIANDSLILSHDTDFSMEHNDITIQLVCDEGVVPYFALRFYKLHTQTVIGEVYNTIKTEANEDFVMAYAKDIIDWQRYYAFPMRFNVSNVMNKQFVDTFTQFFHKLGINVDVNWARYIHKIWISHNVQ